MQGSSGGNPGAPAPRRDPHPSSADRVWFRKRRKVMAFLLPPIDGRGAHPDAPELDGAAGGPMTRLTGANFADDQRTPVDGPGAREISNAVFGEGDPDVPNPEGISYLANGFGQFVAHDLAATAGDNLTHLAIAVPGGDASFAPGGTIDITRLPVDPESGEPINPATSAADLGLVYGPDAATLATLRAPGGKLLLSPDGASLPTDPSGVSWLVGDARALENPDLASMHVLWAK